jgi:hypothetical protein
MQFYMVENQQAAYFMELQIRVLCQIWWADHYSLESQNDSTQFSYACPQAGRALTFCLEKECKQRLQASPSRSRYGRARAAQKSRKNDLKR